MQSLSAKHYLTLPRRSDFVFIASLPCHALGGGSDALSISPRPITCLQLRLGSENPTTKRTARDPYAVFLLLEEGILIDTADRRLLDSRD